MADALGISVHAAYARRSKIMIARGMSGSVEFALIQNAAVRDKLNGE